MFFFSKSKSKRLSRKPAARKARLGVEALESRLVPYALSGNAWPHPELVTISFVPDGTIVGANANGYIYSNLFASMNAKFGSTAAWQNQVLKAAQVWAKYTNLNFTFVPDYGAPIGNGSYQQGSPSFGDIRIGGFNFGTTTLAQAYLPPPVNNYSIAGDFQFNTSRNWTIGQPAVNYDLFTVAMHEFGHVLGLNHSGVVTAAMYSSWSGAKTGLAGDDVNGIRAIYSAGNGRTNDLYDLGVSNGSFSNASEISESIDPSALTALVTDLDITTSLDVDYYRFVVPAGTSGTMTVKLQSQGLSQLEPYLLIYSASQEPVAYTDTTGTYGTTLSITLTGVQEGQTYFVRAGGDDSSSPFGTGRYALTLNFGDGPSPDVPLPDTMTANGNPLSGGGGQATRVQDEYRANTTTATSQNSAAVALDAAGNYVVVWRGDQGGTGDIYAQRFDVAGTALGTEFRVNTTTTNTQTDPSVAMDAQGNFVVVWASDQTGSNEVYAKRFSAAGVALGGEFRVNTYTSGSQREAEVAMDPLGNFVVVWTSSGQDGSGDAVYARRYNAAGVAQGGEFRVNTYTTDDQDDAAVSVDANGNFVVVWESYGQDGSGEGIFARQYGADGLAWGEEFQVNCTTYSTQSTPSVGMDDSGNFVVAWQSSSQDGSGYGIFAQRYDAWGWSLDCEFQVNTYTAGAQEFSNASLVTSDADNTVAMDANGDFVITWMSNLQDGSGYGIYAQQFDAHGEPLGTEIAVNTTTAGGQMAPAVAMANNGDFVIVWQGNGPGDADGIESQRYTVNALAALNLAVHGYSEDGCDHDHDHTCGGCAEEGYDGHTMGCDCPACTTAVDPQALPASLCVTDSPAYSAVDLNLVAGSEGQVLDLKVAPADQWEWAQLIDALFAAHAWRD